MRYETAHNLFISNKHWSKLTSCIDDVWMVDSQYYQRKWSMRYETAQKLSINNKHWSKLTCCIDDLWIVDSQYYQKHEAWDMKQFTSYPLTTNPEVNLPAVLMMCKLLIHSIIKEH